ncbi:MAG: CPBP family intramembrane metalloprotease [Taibaiella sp.]|nr:CPBP family intramembrane metalloprotease [Taibaiella sp.]
MKYFREYPWGFQLSLFLLMAFTFISGASAIVQSVLPKATGHSIEEILAFTTGGSASLKHAFLAFQALNSVSVFFLPAAVFAYLATPRPAAYLGVRKPGKPVHWLLSVLIMAGAMPVLMMIQQLMHNIDFGPGLKASHEAQMKLSEALMVMNSPAEFISVFLVMAITPAIGEELFFRGVFLRFVRKRTLNMVVPVLFTAVIFSFVHPNLYGYISIFLAGVLLAVIYQLTGSILCSMAGHLYFNGLQVVLLYFGNSNATIKDFVSREQVSWTFVTAGAAVFAGSFYLLLKSATPLPVNWTDDFSRAEIDERNSGKSAL